jgi:hypothetical protein
VFLAFDFDFIYAGFSPVYSMKPKASSKKDIDFKAFKELAFLGLAPHIL